MCLFLYIYIVRHEHYLCTMHNPTYGHVSICMWLCIHMAIAMHVVFTCPWPSSHVLVDPSARRRLVICHGPQRRIVDNSAKSHERYLKACRILEGTVRRKIVHVSTALSNATTIHGWNNSKPRKKLDSALWGQWCKMKFALKYLSKFEVELKTTKLGPRDCLLMKKNTSQNL